MKRSHLKTIHLTPANHKRLAKHQAIYRIETGFHASLQDLANAFIAAQMDKKDEERK